MTTAIRVDPRPANGPDAAPARSGSARSDGPLEQTDWVEAAGRFERDLKRLLEPRYDAQQRACRIVGAARKAMRRAARRGVTPRVATAAIVAAAVRVAGRSGGADHSGTLPHEVQLAIGGVLDTALEFRADLEATVTAAMETVVDAAGDSCLRDLSRDDVTIAVRACLFCAAYVLGVLHGKEARSRIIAVLLSPRPTGDGASSDPTGSATRSAPRRRVQTRLEALAHGSRLPQGRLAASLRSTSSSRAFCRLA